jgi:hypothetical protein
VAAVAVVCARCRTRFTYPLPNLAEAFRTRDGDREHWTCPHCHALAAGEGSGSAGGPFRAMAEALGGLKDLADRIEVRFLFRRPHGGEGGGP